MPNKSFTELQETDACKASASKKNETLETTGKNTASIIPILTGHKAELG
jgi:hypothetical protein